MSVPVRNLCGEPEPFVLEEFAAHFAFVVTDAVVSELAAPTKREAIEVLVRRLAEAGAIPPDQQSAIAAAVLDREELGTTGIGRGVAVPHAKHSAVERVVAALAYSPTGLDFNSIDGEPVHLICLLISPLQGSTDHLLALQALSRQIANQDCGTWCSPHRHRHEEPAA
jgi:PTS system fructose-specific IIA component/PTS system nitrogen regulatory IIA component